MPSSYEFGPFRFDPAPRLLVREGVPVAMGGRAAAILGALLVADGRVVGKDALIEAAWPGVAVEESNLSVQVSKLRRILGDERIRTVERVGYQLVAGDPAGLNERPRPHNAFPSVALAGGNQHRAILAELAIALSRFKTLHVVAEQDRRRADYQATLKARRTGRDADEGLTVTLSDVQSGDVLWGASYPASATQENVAEIVSSIESEVQAAESMRGPNAEPGTEAYALYLRGRRALDSSLEADNRIAFGLLMAAVELEPENPAYLAAATEAIHHRLSAAWEPLGPDDKRICRELAYRTLAVAGTDAVAIALAGNGLFTADEEALGLELCRRALKLNPTSPLVLACALLAERWGGTMDDSEAIARKGLRLAPNAASQRFALGGLATALSWRGDFNGALDLGRRSLAYGPGFVGGHYSIVDALIGLGRQEEAERHLARHLSVSPGVTVHRYERAQPHADRSRVAKRIDSLRRAGMPER